MLMFTQFSVAAAKARGSYLRVHFKVIILNYTKHIYGENIKNEYIQPS